MSERGIITIDIASYRHNLQIVRDCLAPGTKLMAVVKANAYGHGLVEIAKSAVEAGSDYLGVATIDEVQELRNAGVMAPCMLLGPCHENDAHLAADLDITITVMDHELVNKLEEYGASNNKPAKVHLYVDTGMQRGGIDPEQCLETVQFIHEQPHVELEGIYTHFAAAEETDPTFFHEQLATFNTCVQELGEHNLRPSIVHAANSAAAIAFPEAHFDMVRVGLASYGVNPFPKEHEKHTFCQENLQPVLQLTSRVTHLRAILPNTTVGYNRTWTAGRETTLALIPVGYGDGITRALHEHTIMLIHGQAAPIVGHISMDQLVVDVTDIPNVTVGDKVIVIDNAPGSLASVESLAHANNASPYEIITELSARLPRKYEA